MAKPAPISQQTDANCLKDAAFLARALADENRLRILLSIRDQQKTVTRIVEEVGLSQPLVSHHLKELKRALLVDVERSGPFVLYRLGEKRVLEILAVLRQLADDRLTLRRSF